MATDVAGLIDAVIKREIISDALAYIDDPDDPGGPTCWGITEAVARAYGYTGPMQTMPKTTAIAIYRERFWLLPRLDQVDVICPTIAEKLFDIGVNLGDQTGLKFLQRALNALNYGATYPDLALDGLIGRMTLYALQHFLAQRGEPGRTALLAMLRAQQAVRYIEIVEAKPSQKRWIYGWEQRVTV